MVVLYAPRPCWVDQLTDWLINLKSSVHPSTRPSVTLSVAPCRGSRQWQGVASNTTATTGCDCLVGGAAAPRYSSLALPLAPFFVLTIVSIAHTPLSSLLVTNTTSQHQPPLSHRCGSPLESRDGAATAAVAATAAATTADDDDGDGLCEGLCTATPRECWCRFSIPAGRSLWLCVCDTRAWNREEHVLPMPVA